MSYETLIYKLLIKYQVIFFLMVKADRLLILIGGLQCRKSVHTAFQPVEVVGNINFSSIRRFSS